MNTCAVRRFRLTKAPTGMRLSIVADHTHRDNATIIGYTHAYDKLGNPNYEMRTHQSSYGEEYTYDNL